MIQSYLVLTQSFLQINKLNQILAWDFFGKNKFDVLNIDQITNELKTDKNDLEKLEIIDKIEEKTETLPKEKSKNKMETKTEIKVENNLENNLENKINVNWHKFQANGQILIANFDDKKDCREQILTFYQNYSKPTLLFLGNLENYSIPLQEGFLKFLEEPPNNLFIILLASNSSAILPTILSRTHKILLTNSTVFSLLDKEILEKIGKNLPGIREIVKEILLGKMPLIDLKKVERNEFDMWLWQIEKCLEEVFRQKHTQKSAKYLTKILEIRKLNSQNLQKKLAWAGLL